MMACEGIDRRVIFEFSNFDPILSRILFITWPHVICGLLVNSIVTNDGFELSNWIRQSK